MAFQNRIVVTGLGAVTPFGVGVETFWTGILSNQSAVREMSDGTLRQWSPAAAEVPDFDALKYLPRKLVMDTDRFTQLGLVATIEALRDAGFQANGAEDSDTKELLRSENRDRIGIAIGSAFGGVQSLEAGSAKLATGASNRVSPRLVSKSIPNAAAAAIAMRYGIRGPVMTYTTACASAANAIGEASYWLRTQDVDMVLAGGAECLFSPAILAGLRAAGALAVTGPEEFRKWSRPFDTHRQGMVMGEGAAMLVLETLEHALARGAHIYAELGGYGASNDAYHETSPHPKGIGAALAMDRALQSGGLKPEDIDYINAHATSTPAGDLAEAEALRSVFGQRLNEIPVSSIKGAVGHMLGAAGAIESIACIQTLRTGWLPPTVNCENKEESAPGDVVPESRQQKVNRILSNSFGFGGQNGVLLWERYDG